MKVFRLNENAELPEFEFEGSSCFNIKACLKGIQYISFFNPLNKETKTPVKIINGKISVQLYPGQRMKIPTGLIFNVPKENVIKVYSNAHSALSKGLVLANQAGVISSNNVEETFISIRNTSDAVIFIEDGETIAQGKLEKTHVYNLTEAKNPPSN